jgi:ABC-2 type transport system ATP-binding protein
VSTTGLTKRFSQRTVVDDVALAIPDGSVCGFVGPNGAGKTTTIRMLLGLVRPTSGSGSILGGSLADPASYLHKVGALIESPAFYPQLSGRDNLTALARLGRIPLSAVGPGG